MIVRATSQHLPALLNLWAGYQDFYQVQEIDFQRNQHFIEHILAHPQEGIIEIYLSDDEAIAFSTLYFTYSSTAACKVAVLNDLYVDPAYRQHGIARALLERAKSVVKEEGILTLRWTTQASNTQARALYEQYAQPSEWLLYTLKV